jgi:hypothetical protein
MAKLGNYTLPMISTDKMLSYKEQNSIIEHGPNG